MCLFCNLEIDFAQFWKKMTSTILHHSEVSPVTVIPCMEMREYSRDYDIL